MVTGAGTQKYDTKTGMQEEALYLVMQAKILSRVNRQAGS